jgi:hypothetical protein
MDLISNTYEIKDRAFFISQKDLASLMEGGLLTDTVLDYFMKVISRYFGGLWALLTFLWLKVKADRVGD